MKSWSVVSALATTLGVCGYIARTDVLSLGNRPEKATPPERVLTWAQWGAAALLNADDRWQVVIVGSLALAFLAFVVGSINDAFRDEPSQIYVGKRENSFWTILRRVWPIDDLLIAHMSRTFYYGLIVVAIYFAVVSTSGFSSRAEIAAREGHFFVPWISRGQLFTEHVKGIRGQVYSGWQVGSACSYFRPFVKADKPHWKPCDSLYDQETSEIAVGGAAPTERSQRIQNGLLGAAFLIFTASVVYVSRKEVKRFSATSGSFVDCDATTTLRRLQASDATRLRIQQLLERNRNVVLIEDDGEHVRRSFLSADALRESIALTYAAEVIESVGDPGSISENPSRQGPSDG